MTATIGPLVTTLLLIAFDWQFVVALLGVPAFVVGIVAVRVDVDERAAVMTDGSSDPADSRSAGTDRSDDDRSGRHTEHITSLAEFLSTSKGVTSRPFLATHESADVRSAARRDLTYPWYTISPIVLNSRTGRGFASIRSHRQGVQGRTDRMVTVTLDDRDRAILERLREGDADVESLAETASCRPEYLVERLPELADNGLVQRVDDDVYRITANGKRAIAGSPAGTMDNRIDTPAEVEDRIESFDLRPDREEAVRNAFAFLHYWGAAHGSEIVDGVYSENPAGFDASEEWWTDCVRERLAALALVEPPSSTEQPWRYAGTAIAEKVTEDGRIAPEDDVTTRTSVKFALERSGLSEGKRSAVRAAFELLTQEGEASAAAIKDRVYPDHDAGYDSAAEWWIDCVRDGLGSLPGVERADDTGDVWRYRQVDEGQMSSEPGAEPPDGAIGPEDDRDG